MSKHETWRTRKYWQSVGGLLIEEFIAVKGTKEQGVRLVDGLIVLGEETKIYEGNTYDITGKDVIVIQTKKQRIGMYLLGQAYFSKLLIEKHNPKSVKSVAICGKNDTVMQELADKHYLEVIVITEKEKYV
jgi:hypothetical protein